VANKFANNTNVIGFDPINEPFPADIGSDTSLMEPGVFDKEKLAPLYEKVHAIYMKASP
jgi:aryl-phospho-beta-D-glucosidase BglC (GH1 family)